MLCLFSLIRAYREREREREREIGTNSETAKYFAPFPSSLGTGQLPASAQISGFFFFFLLRWLSCLHVPPSESKIRRGIFFFFKKKKKRGFELVTSASLA
jgi:hypothetical protein